jgi:hypothetical protein
MSSQVRPIHLRTAAASLLIAAAIAAPAASAAAHGFSSVVFVDASQTGDTIRTEVGLEYDLLVVSVAENEDAPALFEDGMAAFGTGDEGSVLNAHSASVVAYVTERFEVTTSGQACRPAVVGSLSTTVREGVPYAVVTLDHDCPSASVHEIRSGLFPDSEDYVAGTVTMVEYELDGQRGNAVLDSATPVLSTEQPLGERLAHFFLLGAEHLLFGIDHILFLLALIVGSRRLRDVALAATSFTVAHSVTFILAALGLVSVPARVVEPIIALSIAVVAGWYLVRLWRSRRRPALELVTSSRLRSADWARLAIVFAFGLVHGLGFAGALGIDEPFSWPLLASLLVFNVGIEAVQVGVIVIVFPLLLLLGRRAPRVALAAGALVAGGVAVVGLVWFVERMVGAG